jgi:hypothetical protein
MTLSGIRVETSCKGFLANGAIVDASNTNANNRCHVDCSNNGLCNHAVGQCACFSGHYGNACQYRDALANYVMNLTNDNPAVDGVMRASS